MNCRRDMASVSATQFSSMFLLCFYWEVSLAVEVISIIPSLIVTAHWQMQTYDTFQNVHWQLSRGLISRIFHDGRRQMFHFKAFISWYGWHGAWWTQVIWGAGVKRKGAPTCKVKQSWTHPNILVKTKTLLLCDSDVITLCNQTHSDLLFNYLEAHGGQLVIPNQEYLYTRGYLGICGEIVEWLN